MTLADDAQKLLRHCENAGLDLTKSHKRGWNHMGAVIVDSALQSGMSYKTVLTRVKRVLEKWPQDTALSAIAHRFNSVDLTSFLGWNNVSKIAQIRSTVRVLQDHRVETTRDFAALLDDDGTEGASLRYDLRAISGVGDATMEYLRILVGLDGRKIDRHIARFARDAGLAKQGPTYIGQVLDEAARLRRVAVGSLDAAIWEYESSR